MRPVVVVSAPRRIDAGRERVALNVAYVRALERAGLVPLVVPTTLDPAHLGDALSGARGLVLTGGEDVDPARYHAAPHPKLEPPDPMRDAAELALIAAAGARRLPILAICRGIQILNVCAGGTLYQDLPSERPGSVDHQGETARHSVRIAPGSITARVFGGAAQATVNSRHHQAVKDLGAGLRATAWADDDVIEAAERADPGEPWLVAVQWHPEDLDELALFRAFADAVR
jgi:gamma-glutamyl-gamma-aminobutyrate hydrolase PuuD